jgi:hypothetical protein
MRPAPIRRIAAAAGLIALVPLAVRLYTGELTAAEAALRGLAVLLAVVVLTWLGGWGLRMVLQAVERDEAVRRAAGDEVGGAQ